MAPEEMRSRPSARDVGRRLVVLKYVVAYGLTVPPRDMLAELFKKWDEKETEKFRKDAKVRCEHFWQPLRKAGLWDYVAESECALAETTFVTITPQQHLIAIWRMESAQVLMWALGLLSDMPAYDKQADPELLKAIPPDIAAFVSSAQLRDESEVESARDLAELWHWRSRTRQIIESGEEFPASAELRAQGLNSYDDVVRLSSERASEEGRIPECIDGDFPVSGKPYRALSDDEWSEVRSISMERHFALNWLCGYAPGNDWDHTPTES